MADNSENFPASIELYDDATEFIDAAVPWSPIDAMALELAVRDALDNGQCHCCGYDVRIHPRHSTVSTPDYQLVLTRAKRWLR